MTKTQERESTDVTLIAHTQKGRENVINWFIYVYLQRFIDFERRNKTVSMIDLITSTDTALCSLQWADQ